MARVGGVRRISREEFRDHVENVEWHRDAAMHILVSLVARQIKARYRRATKNQRAISLAQWLIAARSLENTYSGRHYGVDARRFWAHQVVRDAAKVTSVDDSDYMVFARKLSEQLGVEQNVEIVLAFHQKKYGLIVVVRQTLRFRRKHT